MRWLYSITNLMNMNLSKLQEMVKDREANMLQFTGLKRVRHDLATEQQQPCFGKYVKFISTTSCVLNLSHSGGPSSREELI